MPDDLALDAEAEAYAAQLGVTGIADEWTKFVEKAREKGKVSCDWYASWRAWCVDALKYQRRDRDRDRSVVRVTGDPIRDRKHAAETAEEERVKAAKKLRAEIDARSLEEDIAQRRELAR